MVTFALSGTAAVGAATVSAARGGGGVVPAQVQALTVSSAVDRDDSITAAGRWTEAVFQGPGGPHNMTWHRCIDSAPSDLMAASARACAAASCGLLPFATVDLRAATTFCWISDVSLRDRLCEACSKPLIWGRGPGLPPNSSTLALPRSRCADAVAARPRITAADSATWACMPDLNRPIQMRGAMTVQTMREGSDAAAAAAAAAL